MYAIDPASGALTEVPHSPHFLYSHSRLGAGSVQSALKSLLSPLENLCMLVFRMVISRESEWQQFHHPLCD